MLPTDERFQKLSDETKELLFHIYVCTPTESDYLLEIKRDLLDKPEEADEKTKEVAESMGIDIEEAIKAIGDNR